MVCKVLVLFAELGLGSGRSGARKRAMRRDRRPLDRWTVGPRDREVWGHLSDQSNLLAVAYSESGTGRDLECCVLLVMRSHVVRLTALHVTASTGWHT